MVLYQRKNGAATPAHQRPGVRKYSSHGIYNFDSDDEVFALAETVPPVPCSPHIIQPTQILANSSFATQPTQLVGGKADVPEIPTGAGPGRTAAPPSLISSPVHSSDIEVPASSPFRQQASAARSSAQRFSFASRIAPPGTSFNPPYRPLQQQRLPSMSNSAPIVLSSDDEGDLMAHRADLQRTEFSRKVSSFKHAPASGKTSGGKDAFGILMGKPAPSRTTITTAVISSKRRGENVGPAEPAPKKRLVRGLRGLPTRHRSPISLASSQSSNDSDLPEMPTEPKSKPKGRRLQRGLPPRSSPVSSQYQAHRTSSPDPIADAEPIIISDTDPDAFEVDSDSEVDAIDAQDRLLNCLNQSPVEDLLAMCKRDRADLNFFISRRPFASVSQARKVHHRKTSSSSSSRVQVGDAIVESVDDFLKATAAIDDIVADCEARAKKIKGEMDTWDIDMFGRKRGAAADEGQPLTPNSFHEFASPPIARQPSFMDGHCQMKAFQHFGLNWMAMCYRNNFGCILADEMGLGKTCQVISLMSHLVQSGQENGKVKWPNLVVVPPSTYSNWLIEFERFAPDLCVIGYQGTQAHRAEIGDEILDDPEAYHVVLTTYTQVTSNEDIDMMRRLRPNVAVFDEGHKMKNPTTKLYEALFKIPARWRMLLTGTPVQNNLLEMIALLRFINPKLFGGHLEDYIQIIFNSKVSVRDVGHSAFLYSERVQRARSILEPFILQRRKQQVTEMPKKMRTVVYCHLTETQQPIYREYEARFKSDGPKKTKKGGRANDQNNVWIQLRKAALHPQLFRRFFDDATVERMAKILMAEVPQSELQQPRIEHLTGELKNLSDFEMHLWCRDYPCIAAYDVPDSSYLDSGKVRKLLALIDEYRTNGDRVLVFSKFAKVLDILTEAFANAGIRHCILSGATDVGDRQGIIDEFTNDKSIPAFLLTTAAGGTGINLTAANKVVIFDQSDNPQDDIQAENRAHRLGQTRDVEIIRLIARDTVEELIYKACEKKIELANKVTGADDDGDAGAGAERNLEAEVRKMMASKQPTPP